MLKKRKNRISWPGAVSIRKAGPHRSRFTSGRLAHTGPGSLSEGWPTQIPVGLSYKPERFVAWHRCPNSVNNKLLLKWLAKQYLSCLFVSVSRSLSVIHPQQLNIFFFCHKHHFLVSSLLVVFFRHHRTASLLVPVHSVLSMSGYTKGSLWGESLCGKRHVALVPACSATARVGHTVCLDPHSSGVGSKFLLHFTEAAKQNTYLKV